MLRFLTFNVWSPNDRVFVRFESGFDGCLLGVWSWDWDLFLIGKVNVLISSLISSSSWNFARYTVTFDGVPLEIPYPLPYSGKTLRYHPHSQTLCSVRTQRCAGQLLINCTKDPSARRQQIPTHLWHLNNSWYLFQVLHTFANHTTYRPVDKKKTSKNYALRPLRSNSKNISLSTTASTSSHSPPSAVGTAFKPYKLAGPTGVFTLTCMSFNSFTLFQ